MKHRLRLVATGLLVLLAAAFALGIALLYDWGGRVETLLLVFGNRVWVTIDAGHPRLLLLLLVPVVFLGAAVSVYPRRSNTRE